MPTLVHMADERDARSIEKNGIKKGRNGCVFFMPVTKEFYPSHQWLRELKSRGARNMVGVYFRLPSDEPVWFGKYHEVHRKVTLGLAIGEFMKADDKLGFEFVIERKILANEIEKIRQLPQALGWRYSPQSHSKGLSCPCPICITRGSIRASRKRNRVSRKQEGV